LADRLAKASRVELIDAGSKLSPDWFWANILEPVLAL
jgi:hypothetical protein